MMNTLNKKDTVTAIVTGSNEKGNFLVIPGVNLVCRIFNSHLDKGTQVLASISKIYDDYIILDLDSVDYDSIPYSAA